MSEHRIVGAESIIIDLPLRRIQRFAALGADRTAVVLIRLKSDSGYEGIGECCTPSGPWWGGESIESIKLIIDTYLKPLLPGSDPFDTIGLFRRMDRKLFGNMFAKAGVEMALLDLQGKILQIPVHDLLGGRQRSSLPCSWPLASGDPEVEIEEAIENIERKKFNIFKLKMGFLDPVIDVDRACKVARALDGKASVRADPNESWDETTCKWAIPKMEQAGISMVEQPLKRWNLEGSARVTARYSIAIMADESLSTLQDLFRISRLRAADLVSLKVMKSGGLINTRRQADVAIESGLSVYMGTFLECSLGTAANMQLAATLDDLPYGGELSGPCLVAEDITIRPARYENHELQLEPGIGIAAELDHEKVEAFRRDRTYSQHTVTTGKFGQKTAVELS
ncbi:MAG: chloromuconate cycloisomerase [Hyphomonadaceae bacterium]|nr:chloromuconate cycloisomerase [Hyphomonadaceae bacterium]MBC6411918.1 chloromuconate cycloisomerase [Hyphomonadaceae bacterium]